MEGMTKYFGAKILISEESHQYLSHPEDFHFRYLGEVIVKGKHKPVKIYECVDGDHADNKEKKILSLSNFNKGLGLYYSREFPEALVVFKEILKQNSKDQPAEYFYKMAAKYAAEGVPDDWRGVDIIEHK